MFTRVISIAGVLTLLTSSALLGGVSRFDPDGKPPTRGFVAVYAYKWLRDNHPDALYEDRNNVGGGGGTWILLLPTPTDSNTQTTDTSVPETVECDRETDFYTDLRQSGVSEFKRRAINCLASIGFFEHYPPPDGRSSASFDPDGKPPTRGFVAVYAYKWLRDHYPDALARCDRETDFYDDLERRSISSFKRQAINCLASVGFFDNYPEPDEPSSTTTVFSDYTLGEDIEEWVYQDLFVATSYNTQHYYSVSALDGTDATLVVGCDSNDRGMSIESLPFFLTDEVEWDIPLKYRFSDESAATTTVAKYINWPMAGLDVPLAHLYPIAEMWGRDQLKPGKGDLLTVWFLEEWGPEYTFGPVEFMVPHLKDVLAVLPCSP